MVDVGMIGVFGVKFCKFWEVMDMIIVINYVDIEFIVVVNIDFWNGLLDVYKDII